LPALRRTARFHCVITVAEPSGEFQSVDGVIEGVITEEARGIHGFGYDPIFFVSSLGKTTAELLPEQKNQISHRAQAARLARTLLENWPISPSFQDVTL